MGMNRPSLYAAFGDKQTLTLKALNSFRDQAVDAMRALLSRDEPLACKALDARLQFSALPVFCTEDDTPRGWLVISTAADEGDPSANLASAPPSSMAYAGSTRDSRRRIARAVEQGELPATANPRTLPVFAF